MRKYILFFWLLVMISNLAYSQNPFRSRQSGNWNDANTWEEDTGGGFAITTNTPTSAAGAITILNGHTVTVITDLTVDELTIQSTGTLLIDPNVNANPISVTVSNGTGTDITVNGTFNLLDDGFGSGSLVTVSANATMLNAGSVSLNDPSLSSITFSAGSTYQHEQNGGAVPAAIWAASSNCAITGMTTSAPSGLSQTFGNFIWNCAGQTANANLALTSSTTIAGNFTIQNSSNGVIAQLVVINASANATVEVSGDFGVSGLSRFATTNSAAVTLRVFGNFSYASTSANGSILGGNLGTTNSVVEVRGNFTYSSGLLSKTGTAGSSAIIFAGSSPQIYTGGGTAINTAINYQINNGSTLDLGTNSLAGTGSFTLNAGGTLRVGSTDSGGALQTGAAGNILVTGSRTYSGGATIVYNGAAAQVTGDAFPSDVNLTINNSAGVSMNNNVQINSGRALN